MDLRELLEGTVLFDWDEWNVQKNWNKHRVQPSECEDLFFNDPVFDFDRSHSQKKERFFAYGVTEKGRHLFVAFTIRRGKVRVISARDMSRKERRFHREKAKENSTL